MTWPDACDESIFFEDLAVATSGVVPASVVESLATLAFDRDAAENIRPPDKRPKTDATFVIDFKCWLFYIDIGGAELTIFRLVSIAIGDRNIVLFSLGVDLIVHADTEGLQRFQRGRPFRLLLLRAGAGRHDRSDDHLDDEFRLARDALLRNDREDRLLLLARLLQLYQARYRILSPSDGTAAAGTVRSGAP